MNYLAHLYLSGASPGIVTGNFMGDFIKGRVGDGYPPAILSGIRLHRGIDSFVQSHSVFHRSRQRISLHYGHFRGVMVDLFCDHFLAHDWHQWAQEPLSDWLGEIRQVVEANVFHLPEPLVQLLPVIFDDLIPSYKDIDGVGRALERMSRRIGRPNPLRGGEIELSRHYGVLRNDFYAFMPDVRRFAADFLANEFHPDDGISA